MHKGRHYKGRKSEATAMEETGIQSSIKCPEGRGPLICTKKYKYSRYRTEKKYVFAVL